MIFVFRRGHCIVTVTYCSVAWARSSLARLRETYLLSGQMPYQLISVNVGI